jgi:hypothetical protein
MQNPRHFLAMGLLLSMTALSAACSKGHDNDVPPPPPPEKPSGRDYTDTELLKRLNVKITTTYSQGIGFSKGSGVCLAENLIATNYHVVYPAKFPLEKIEVQNIGGLTARVIGIAVTRTENDLVVVKTDRHICDDFVPKSDILSLKATDTDVIHVGNPLDTNWQVRPGTMESPVYLKSLSDAILSSVNWITADTKVARTTINTTHGSSGGGVYSKDGLVGILFAGGQFDQKKEVLVISADNLNKISTASDMISFETLRAVDPEEMITVLVNGEQTKMMLSPRFLVAKAANVNAVMRSDLFTEARFKAVLAHKMRSMQFYNFSPDQTAIIVFADRNDDGKVDAIMTFFTNGIIKTLADHMSLADAKKGYARAMILDDDFNGVIDGVEVVQ